MKNIITYLILGVFILGCSSTSPTTQSDALPDGAVKIANEELEYEIIIIDQGFETYLYSIAKPANFYSQEFYEIKNQRYVIEWNIRTQNPMKYNSNIYEMEINYDPKIDYGLDVNYKLYNYFKFVEYKYKERFF
jgi:hypothetical protein